MPTATDEPNIPNKKESAVTDNGTEELTGEKEEISRQEIVALGIASRERADNIEFCEHVMKALARGAQGPNLWGREDFKTTRECVCILLSWVTNCQMFHCLESRKMMVVVATAEKIPVSLQIISPPLQNTRIWMQNYPSFKSCQRPTWILRNSLAKGNQKKHPLHAPSSL